MTKARVIVCLDISDGRVVKGTNFVGLRDAGDPVELAARYVAEGADEIMFLDIGATPEGRGTTVELMRQVANVVSVPFTVAGGIRSVEDAIALRNAGADRVSVASAAVARPQLVAELADALGSEHLVVAIDAKRVVSDEKVWFEVMTSGGQQSTGLDAVEFACEVVRLGAGEILVTSVDRDGTGEGFDLELTRSIADAVTVPVVASGGVGTLSHLVEGVTEGGALGVLAASIFHFGTHTVSEVKEALASNGIAVHRRA